MLFRIVGVAWYAGALVHLTRPLHFPCPMKRAKKRVARRDDKALRLPLPSGARLVASGFLEDATRASARLGRETDEKALHEFRVAIRRLRSWLRAFRADFEDVVRKEDRRQLRDIAAATNLGRDTHVQIDWLRGAAKGLHFRRKRGASWLKEYLETRRLMAGDPMDEELIAEFRRVHDDLEARLARYGRRGGNGSKHPSLGAALASQLMPHVEELWTALDDVQSVTQEIPAHKARIQAKRLRYLLEPAAPFIKKGPELLAMLKELQDELGALHDAHLLGHELRSALEASALASIHRASDRALGRPEDNGIGPATALLAMAPRSALLTLAKRVRDDAGRAFKHVKKDWLRGRYHRFSREMELFAKRLEKKYA